MNDSNKTLDDLLADLPRDLPPPPYLWPGIARRLPRRHRRAPPMLLAAAAPAPQVVVAAAQAPSLDEPRNASYVAARDSLELNFRQRLALLDPATRAKIEANLAIIRQAHEDIRKALASDPASPVLEQLWQSTWHDEIDLYDHVVRATQPAMTRT